MDMNKTGTSLEVKQGMARAFFLSAYSEAWEEAPDTSPNKIKIGIMGGRNWEDVAPKENDPAAEKAADDLARALQDGNGVTDLGQLYRRAVAAKEFRVGDRELTPHNFGFYLAMQAMGHGVGLWDAFGDAVSDAVKVAGHEFGALHLEKDYF